MTARIDADTLAEDMAARGDVNQETSDAVKDVTVGHIFVARLDPPTPGAPAPRPA